MTDKRYTEKQRVEIETAVLDELQDDDYSVSASKGAARRIMARLTRPEIRDDCPVMYDHGAARDLVSAGDVSQLINVTNIRALIPEDKVLEWVDEVFGQYTHASRNQMNKHLTAKMDAHKRGEG